MTDKNEGAARTWLSPAGIGALAAVAGVLVTLVALFVTRGDGTPTNAPPSGSAAEATYLFVYGTTMPGHVRYPQIEEFVAEVTPDQVIGQLYDSGSGYPAAKFGGGQSTIEGYLLRLRPERVTEAQRTLTQIEAGLFQPVTVETASGKAATAYEWIGSTDGLEPLEGMWNGPEE